MKSNRFHVDLALQEDHIQSLFQHSSSSTKHAVNKQHVHKTHAVNNFVKSVQLAESHPEHDLILSEFTIPPDHPFFFEHEKGHIPGLMLIEAGRQAGTAMAHLIYHVDFDQAFILEDMDVEFLAFSSLDSPLYAYNLIRDKKIRRGKLTALTAEGYFVQNGKRIAYMRSTWKIIPEAILKRLKA